MTDSNEGIPAIREPNRMPPEIEQTLEELLCRFREKFGRNPKENDPIFFDPHSDEPVPLRPEVLNEMWDRMADAMVFQGEITPETAYAMKKTGLLVTEETKDLLRDTELDEWNNACEEYRTARAERARQADNSARRPVESPISSTHFRADTPRKATESP